MNARREVRQATSTAQEREAAEAIRLAIHAVVNASQACNRAGCDGSAVTQGLESALGELREVARALEVEA